jgi:autotransporter passenger strand-loop-strand repeat protein
VESGGFAYNTVILNTTRTTPGTYNGGLGVSSGGTASGTLISSGGFEAVRGGSENNAIVFAGGTLSVSAGVANNTTVSSGGLFRTVSAGIGSQTVVMGGGSALVSSGGLTVGDLVVGSGASTRAFEFVFSGGIASGTVLSNTGVLVVSSGGLAVGTIAVSNDANSPGSNGALVVSSGGSASGAVISGGGIIVERGGVDSGTVISSGGVENVSSGTAVSGVVLFGGTLNVAQSGSLSGVASATTVKSGGSVYVFDGGVTIDPMIGSGGVEIVSSGGGTSNATIDGGLLDLQNGASAGSSLFFAESNGTLKVDGTTMPTAVISGFGLGDSIDLAGLGFVSSGSGTLLGQNELQIVQGATVEELNLDPGQSFASDAFLMTPDGSGGTNVTLSDDLDAGEQAALKLTVGNTDIGAAAASTVPFTIAGLDVEDTGTVTFTDANNQTVQVAITGGQTSYTANLKSLADGTIASSLQVHPDPAGNSFAAVSGNPVTLDTTAPQVVSVTTSESGDVRAGLSFQLTVDLSEPVTVQYPYPTLQFNDGEVANYEGNPNGNALIFQYDVSPGDFTTELAVTGIDLNGGTIQDTAGNQANFSNIAMSFPGLIIDGIPPVVSNASLSDVYLLGGAPITLSPGITIADDDPRGILFADVGGATYPTDVISVPSSALADTNITATYEQSSGLLFLSGEDTPAHYQQVLEQVQFSTTSSNPADFNNALTRTIWWDASDGASNSNRLYTDLSLDPKPAVTEALAHDTGSLSTDGITSNPSVTGSGNPNTVVQISIDSSPIAGTAMADASGIWSFTPIGLSDGQHTIVASETDVFGNTGTASLTFTLDQDLGEQAALKLTVGISAISAATASAVPFTVAGLDAEDTGTVTFTDVNKKTLKVNVTGGQTTYTVNLTSLADGAITSSLQVNPDLAGNNFAAVAGTTAALTQLDHWTNTSGGSWAAVKNWTTWNGVHQAPTVVIDAVIDASGTYAVGIGASATAYGLILNNAGATVNDKAGGSLILEGSGGAIPNGAMTINAGTFNLSGGALNSGDITIGAGGTLQFSAGYSAFSQAVADSGTLLIKGPNSVNLTGDVSGSGAVDIQGKATATFSGAISGAETFTVANSATAVIDGTDTGTGSFVLAGGGDLTFSSAISEGVTFLSGATGTLTLVHSLTNPFTGTLSGVTKKNAVDLEDLTWTPGKMKATFSGNTSGGTLAITDGPSSVAIKLLGNYTSASWKLSNDGSGGTVVIDPPVTGSLTPSANLGAGIDLSDISYDATTTLGYAPNSDGIGGTLTVSNSQIAQSVALLGQYAASSFVAASNGHGGTLITDPPSSQQQLLALPH